MSWAEANDCGEVNKLGAAFHSRFYFLTHSADEFRLTAAPTLLRVAPAAGAKTSPLCRFWRNEELNVFRARTAGRAGWPAINSSGTYGEYELAIHASVSRRDSRKISAAVRRKHRKRSGWHCHGSLKSFLQHNTEKTYTGAIRILRSNYSHIRPAGTGKLARENALPGRCALGQFNRNAN